MYRVIYRESYIVIYREILILCTGRCNPGYYGADSGLEICHQCPLNSYQPAEGATGCMLCPDDTVTLSQGSVSENSCVGEPVEVL